MRIKEIRRAMTAVLRTADPAARLQNGDVSDPAIRGVYQIEVLPAGISAACAGSRERQAKVEIRYYPHTKYRPRDECDTVAERLVDAFAEGFPAGGTWLIPDEDISFAMTKGVLVLQFKISWSESARETDEPMETLIYDREELTK